MKRILLSACCLLITWLSQAQYCGFDQHLARLIDNNPLVQNQLDRMDSKLATAAQLHGKAAAGANFVIPTVVYVIHSGGPENISDQQIQSQLDAMNLFFGVHGISFCLATQENGVLFTEPTPGIFRINSSLTDHQFGEDSLLMGLSTLSAANYLRIFVVANINQGSGVLGYATFPGTGGVNDGVVMRYEAFGDATTCGCNNLMPNYDQGKVMLHELGHWLNLYHTFHNGCSGNTAGDCNTQGDRVCDTPPVAIPNGGCPNAAPNSCQETPNDQPDLIDNHMDYTDDNCRSAFTPGQRARMQATLTSFRSNLVSPSNLLETGVTCTGGLSAAFESSTKSICTGQPVTFTAFMGASNYTWDLGNGVQLTGNPVTHAFTNPGTVEVTLTVSDGSDTLSSTQQFYAADCSNLRLDQSTWMFGFFAAVDFTTGIATPTARAFLASPSFASSEANVVQMDSNGNVLFSSNGANAWNDADVQISSAPLVSTTIGSTGQIISVPNPANPNQYYVFLPANLESPGLGFNYALIDYTNGGSIVTVDSIPTPGNKVTSELITAVPHCNGTDFWVIAHDSFFGGSNFWVYRVSASGVTNAAGDSPLPDVYSGFNLYASKGTLKVSRDGSLIVMSGFQDGGPAVPSIALYNFDRTTGAIDEERIIFRGRFFTASAAFSATANYVYAVTYNWPDSINEVFKIDLDGNAELLHRTTDVMWGVTLGPDDRIYTSGELRSHLGMVPNPDDQVSLYHHNGVDLTDGYPAAASLLSLPNFIDAYPVSKVEHDFRTFNPSCNTYEFQPTNPCLATSYDWDFGDMNTSTSAMPVHTYTAPGTYDVTLVIDGTDTIVHTIQHGIAGDLFGSDSICLGNEGGLFANNYSTQGCATCSYTWTVVGGSITGPTTQDNVDIQWSTNPASVSVMVTDEATGCQFTESMNVQLSDCVQSASSLSGGWSWNIHPNPSSGAVFVELSGLSTELTIEVISTNGQVVWSKRGFRGNLVRINSGALTKGVYSVRIRNEAIFSTKKLVVY